MIPAGLSRETQIVLDAQGRWWNEGEPIDHPNLVHAFNGWIERHEDGRYILKNSINWAYIHVLDTPLFIESANATDDTIVLTVSDGTQELWRWDDTICQSLTVDAQHRVRCRVRNDTMPALFRPYALTQLSERLHEQANQIGFRFRAGVVYPRFESNPHLKALARGA